MSNHEKERPALLIIDMVKANFDPHKNLPITPLARPIIAPLNRLISIFRDEDCTAAATVEIHEHTLRAYRRNPLRSLMRVIASPELVSDLLMGS